MKECFKVLHFEISTLIFISYCNGFSTSCIFFPRKMPNIYTVTLSVGQQAIVMGEICLKQRGLAASFNLE